MTDTPAPKPVEFADLILLVAIIVWVTMAILLLAFVQIPDKNMPIFSGVVMAGVFGTLGTWVGYRWGNSVGSDKKTDALVQMATKE